MKRCKVIKEIFRNIEELPETVDHWIIAYSGGVDSCVLTDILFKLKPEHIKLSLLHVNHGLGQEDATLWAKQALDTAKKINANFITTEFNMDETGTALEEKARNLRYDFMAKNVSKNSVIFFGHHKNDQAETFLFRLFRGTGIKGLCGIPRSRKIGEGILFRPMLNITREEIKNYAINNDIHWYEDDTNIDTFFSRNFIRHDIIPTIEKRWPKVVSQISSASNKAKEMYDLSIEIAEQDLEILSTSLPDGRNVISCEKLHLLSDLRKKNVLQYYFENILGVSQEAKNFDNSLSVLLIKTNDYSKVRKIILKNYILHTNGKWIWFVNK